MATDDRAGEAVPPLRAQRVQLDDRFLASLTGDSPQDRVEAQELRLLVHQALQDLTAEELRVIELRFRHKKSPGQVASKLGIPRQAMRRLEISALRKLRLHLRDWQE